MFSNSETYGSRSEQCINVLGCQLAVVKCKMLYKCQDLISITYRGNIMKQKDLEDGLD